MWRCLGSLWKEQVLPGWPPSPSDMGTREQENAVYCAVSACNSLWLHLVDTMGENTEGNQRWLNYYPTATRIEKLIPTFREVLGGLSCLELLLWTYRKLQLAFVSQSWLKQLSEGCIRIHWVKRLKMCADLENLERWIITQQNEMLHKAFSSKNQLHMDRMEKPCLT